MAHTYFTCDMKQFTQNTARTSSHLLQTQASGMRATKTQHCVPVLSGLTGRSLHTYHQLFRPEPSWQRLFVQMPTKQIPQQGFSIQKDEASPIASNEKQIMGMDVTGWHCTTGITTNSGSREFNKYASMCSMCFYSSVTGKKYISSKIHCTTHCNFCSSSSAALPLNVQLPQDGIQSQLSTRSQKTVSSVICCLTALKSRYHRY